MKLFLLSLFFSVQLFSFVQSSDEVEKNYNDLRKQFDQLKAESKAYSKEMISLAIKIKETMENKEISQLTSIKFDQLKADLPLSVRVIIWNENTHIFNKHYSKEYLYAIYDGSLYDEKRRYVFTWIPGGRHRQGEWEFSTLNKGETFFIKNVEYKETCTLLQTILPTIHLDGESSHGYQNLQMAANGTWKS